MKRKRILALAAVILTIIAVFAAWKGLHMIYLPKLNEISRERTVLSTFGGLDHRAKTPEGFFYDSNNLTSDHYPLMATRAKQANIYPVSDDYSDIIAEDTVYFTRDNTLYRWVDEDEEFHDEFLFGEEDTRSKQLLSFGAYILIFTYDGRLFYFNTINETDCGEVDKISIPQLDYVCTVNNRVWGCRYDDTHNAIYASKLGDFKVWDDFDSLADSSYALSLGSSGEFTGIAAYQGTPIFFKENYIHRIAGTLPENFTLQTTKCQGVKKYSDDSIVVANERMYYHGRDGIYAYDGNLPVKISHELGSVEFEEAVGGFFDNKLFMNMLGEKGIAATYVYNVDTGLWQKQNEGSQYYGFATYNGELLCLLDEGIIAWHGKSVFTGYEFPKLPFTWYAVTGIIGTDAPGAKYLARMIIRMWMELDATMTIYVEYDSIPEWIPLTTISGDSLKSFSIPLSFDRCDHLRLRFEGKGETKIYTITKDIEKGGEER